jgi:hypothetical protein
VNFCDLKTDTFRRLNESSSAPVFWTEADVEVALNEGYAEISDETEGYERWLTVDLLANRPYYDLRNILPRDVLSVRAAFNNQTSRWLTPSRVIDLEGGDRRWERRTGQAERLFLRSPWWLGYWPRSGVDSGTIKQYYTALPDPMVEDDDEPWFSAVFHLGLVEYALAELWAQDAESDKALASWNGYLGYETALQSWVDGRAGVPMVHGHGENSGLSAR